VVRKIRARAGTSVWVNATSMLHATRIYAETHAKIKPMHVAVVALPQLMLVGMKTATLSAVIIIPVRAKLAKTPVMVKTRTKIVVVLNLNLNASRMLVRSGAKKILRAKKILLAHEHVYSQSMHLRAVAVCRLSASTALA
jgi:hypothetical protein